MIRAACKPYSIAKLFVSSLPTKVVSGEVDSADNKGQNLLILLQLVGKLGN